MIKVNGNPLEIYVTDTRESVLNRIAAKYRTLPEWLTFQPPFKLDTRELIGVVDEDEELSFEAVDNLDAIVNQDTLTFPTDVTIPPDVTRAEAERIFIATNAVLEESSDQPDVVNVYALSMKGLEAVKDVMKVWNERMIIRREIGDKVRKNRELVDAYERRSELFATVASKAYDQPIQQSQKQFLVTYAPVRGVGTAGALFNAIETNENAPYATLGGKYYKVYARHDWKTNGNELKRWSEFGSASDTAVHLKVADSSKTFASVVLSVDVNARVIYARYDVRIGEKYYDENRIYENVASAFRDFELKRNDYRELSIVGYFTFQRACFDGYVLADMIANDPQFNRVMAINEFVKASKATPLADVYVHFTTRGETVSFQNKTKTKTVKCRARAKSVKSLTSLASLVGKVLNIYELKRESVVEKYREYVDDFADACSSPPPLSSESPTRKKSKKKKARAPTDLREAAPEIFAPFYSRRCLNPPRIVDDDHPVEEDDYQTMRFPIKGEPSPTRTYACDNNVANGNVFPGLIKNSLPNKDVFPFIPCCYAKDQSQRKGGAYRAYFYDEPFRERAQNVQEVYTTAHKILPYGVTGILPQKLRRYFLSVDMDVGYEFVRKGITKSPRSAVEAILFAKGQLDGTTRDERERKVAAEWSRLSTIAVAAKQELYDLSVDEIARSLRGSADCTATKFVRVLEIAFNVDIFIFSDDARLVVPPHARCYYKLKPVKETILLYENNADDSPYPHWELIAKMSIDAPQRLIRSFVANDRIVKDTFSVFKSITRSFVNGLPDDERLFPRGFIEMATRQYVDAYGKCRGFDLVFDGVEFSVILPKPTVPFGLEMIEPFTRLPIRVAVADNRAFLTALLAAVGSRTEERSAEANALSITNMGIVYFETPLDADIAPDTLRRISTFSSINTPSSTTTTTIDEFNAKKRLAKLVSSLSVWAASKNGGDLSYNVVQGVWNDNFKRMAGDDFVAYNGTLYSVGLTGTYYVNVPSLEAYERLRYIVDSYAKYHPIKFREYSSKITVDNLFNESSDFDRRRDEYLIEGDDAIERFVLNAASAVSDLKACKSIAINRLDEPQFFSNKRIDRGKLYLLKRVTSTLHAKYALSVWLTKKYNSDLPVPPEETFSGEDEIGLRVYKYVSADDVTLIVERIDEGVIEICNVIGFKVEGVGHLLVALPVDEIAG